MKPTLSMILFFGYSLISVNANAQLQDLLIPVTRTDLVQSESRNDFFLKKNTYFAKRFRIVTVNTELLTTSEQFNIPLFDGDSISVELTKLDIQSDGITIAWTGRQVSPSVSVDELVADGLSRKEAVALHPHLISLSISAAEISYDNTTSTKYHFNWPKFGRFRNSDRNNPSAPFDRLYAVGMTLTAIALGKEYRLHSLETDPRHHVLIEVDPERTFSTGPLDDPNNPEQAAKRRHYRDFIELLGSDPRPPDRDKE